jgi:hypothetical protein
MDACWRERKTRSIRLSDETMGGKRSIGSPGSKDLVEAMLATEWMLDIRGKIPLYASQAVMGRR